MVVSSDPVSFLTYGNFGPAVGWMTWQLVRSNATRDGYDAGLPADDIDIDVSHIPQFILESLSVLYGQ